MVAKGIIYLNPNFPIEDCIEWMIAQSTETYSQEELDLLEMKANLALANYGMSEADYEDLPFSWKLETLKALSGIGN